MLTKLLTSARRLVAAFLAMGATMAGGSAAVGVYDFPGQLGREPEPWMAALPLEWQDGHGYRIDVPVRPLPETRPLLTTVFFEEQPGFALSVWWEPEDLSEPVLLAANLAEGLDGWNQRALLLPANLAAGGGTLVFDSRGSARGIHRLAFSLLESAEALVASERAHDPWVETLDVLTRLSDLEADPSLAAPDAWFGNMIEAYLQEAPEPVVDGVEFVVEIRPAPTRAVLRFEFCGGQSPPQLSVNGVEIGVVSVEVPRLRSAGYLQPAGYDAPIYAGWRRGWAVIPAELLHPGDNSFVFFGRAARDHVRRTMLEMWFPAPLLPPAPAWPDVTEDLAGPLPVADPPSPAPVSAADLFRTSIR